MLNVFDEYTRGPETGIASASQERQNVSPQGLVSVAPSGRPTSDPSQSQREPPPLF